MGILTNFAKSVLGLKGKAPQTFGVDPASIQAKDHQKLNGAQLVVRV
jgi:hypothetical protein